MAGGTDGTGAVTHRGRRRVTANVVDDGLTSTGSCRRNPSQAHRRRCAWQRFGRRPGSLVRASPTPSRVGGLVDGPARDRVAARSDQPRPSASRTWSQSQSLRSKPSPASSNNKRPRDRGDRTWACDESAESLRPSIPSCAVRVRSASVLPLRAALQHQPECLCIHAPEPNPEAREPPSISLILTSYKSGRAALNRAVAEDWNPPRPPRFVPQLFPSERKDCARSSPKTAHLQAFRLVGETGFEPATARPPAGNIPLPPAPNPSVYGLLASATSSKIPSR